MVGSNAIVVQTAPAPAGCAGVFHVDQVLTLELDMAPGDWTALQADATFTVYYPAMLRCGTDPPIVVGVRRKSGTPAGPAGAKVSLKIDVNLYVAGQLFYGLKKISLENGVDGGLVAEGFAWLLHAHSGAVAGRAAWARVNVNGAYVGLYANVEQVDKTFLATRGIDENWFLWKMGEQRTREREIDPFLDALCFEPFGTLCRGPAQTIWETALPPLIDTEQFLRLGAVNAIIANTDGPIGKYNNFFFYDWPCPRIYVPWDLDTVMRDRDVGLDIFVGPARTFPDGSAWQHYLLGHPFFRSRYKAIVTDLVSGPLDESAINGLLARVETAITRAAAEDPNHPTDVPAEVARLRSFFAARLPNVRAQIAADP